MNNSSNLSAGRLNALVLEYCTAEINLQGNPWGDGEAQQAAHVVARLRFKSAQAALREAVVSAPWGQRGALFVDDECDGRRRTVYVNRRPTVVAYCGKIQKVFSKQEAEHEFCIQRAARRGVERAYQAAREEAIWDLARFAGSRNWQYRRGQRGGYFMGRPGAVAANSALHAAATLRAQGGVRDFLLQEEIERRYHGARY